MSSSPFNDRIMNVGVFEFICVLKDEVLEFERASSRGQIDGWYKRSIR